MSFFRAFRSSALTIAAISLAGSATAQTTTLPKTSSDLFKTTTIWKIHLKFTADQWAAMEPKGGGPGPGLGRPMGPPEPSMLLASGFLKGDTNNDGKLSQTEWTALGSKFFNYWDSQKVGKLSADQLREGINSTFPIPGGRGGPGMVAREGMRNGMSGMTGIDFQYVKAHLDFEGRPFKEVAVRYKGNSSFMMARGSDKRSLKIDLNEYVKGQKLAGVATLNLHNCVTDPSWTNEVLSYRLFRDAGVPASRTAYARVFITVDGKWDKKYIGLYSLVENVDKTFSEDHYDGAKGAIFKPATRSLFEYLGEDWSKYQQTYDPKTNLSAAEKQHVIEFAKLVTSATDEDFRAGIDKYLDLEEVARFMAVTVWLSNLDSILAMGQNYYVYLHPKTSKFQILPWDMDHSFGQFPMGGTQEQREKLSIHKPWSGQNRFFERIFATPAFKNVYLAQLARLQNTLAKPERLIAQVDEVARAIRPAVKDEPVEKLATFDKVIAGESVAPTGFGGDAGPRPNFGGPMGMGPVKPIRAFVPVRAQSVADQLAGKSQGETAGGPGGPGPRGGFGPAMFLQPVFLRLLDANKDASVTREEFQAGFAAWFASWNTDKSGALTPDQLRAGINRDFAMPFGGGGPGGPRF